MKGRRRFNLHAEIDVLGTGVGLLHGAGVPQAGKEIGGAENYRDVATRAPDIVGDGHLGETAAHEISRPAGSPKKTIGAGRWAASPEAECAGNTPENQPR